MTHDLPICDDGPPSVRCVQNWTVQSGLLPILDFAYPPAPFFYVRSLMWDDMPRSCHRRKSSWNVHWVDSGSLQKVIATRSLGTSVGLDVMDGGPRPNPVGWRVWSARYRLRQFLSAPGFVIPRVSAFILIGTVSHPQTNTSIFNPPTSSVPSFPQTTTTTYSPPTKRRLATTAMIVDVVAQLSTLYAISFIPFILLIPFSSRRGFPRKRFSPSAIFNTCKLSNSPCSLI